MAKEKQQTLIIVTHDMELSEYADRMVVLQDGKIDRIEKGRTYNGGEFYE